MKHFHVLLAVIFTFSVLFTRTTNAQSIPTVSEVNKFLNNNHFLVTYREGEVVYGTYYFSDVHYCPSGNYGLYGKSVKKTVLGNEQINNWQEFGNWKATKYKGNVGVYIKLLWDKRSFFRLIAYQMGVYHLEKKFQLCCREKQFVINKRQTSVRIFLYNY